MAAPIPSFFKIRLVVLIVGFFLLFFFIGLLRFIYAFDCPVFVGTRTSPVSKNTTAYDAYYTISSTSSDYSVSYSSGYTITGDWVIIDGYWYSYNGSSWYRSQSVTRGGFSGRTIIRINGVDWLIDQLPLYSSTNLPTDCSGVVQPPPNCDDSQKICECGSVSDASGLAVVYFDPFKGADTCSDGGSHAWHRDPDQDLSASSGLSINVIGEPRCFCPGDSDGFPSEVLASPGNLAPLPPGASGPEEQPVDPEVPEPSAACAAACLPRGYLYSDGKCICVDSPSAPVVPGLTDPDDSVGNAGGDAVADSDNLRQLVDQNTVLSNQLADLATIGNNQIGALNDIAAGVGAFGSQISDSLSSGLSDGLSDVSSSIGDLATNIDGVRTSVDAMHATMQDAFDGQFTAPEDPQPYDVGQEFDFVSRTNDFIDQMKSTGLFSLPGQITQNIPTGGDSVMTIEAGQYGTHDFNFADWGNALVVLRTVCLIVFSWIGIRIVTLKR